MFKRIQIENVLSCGKVVLDNLLGVTALIGRNSSGKTNILKSIQWVANSITLNQAIDTFGYPSIYVRFDIILDKEPFRYEFSIEWLKSPVFNEQLEVQTPDGEWKRIVFRQKDKIDLFEHDTKIQIGVATPSLPALIALVPQKKVVKKISKIVNFLKAVRYYPLDEPNRADIRTNTMGMEIVRYVDYKKWLSKYFSDPDPNTSVIMRLLHLFLEKPADYEELKTLLGDNGLELIADIYISALSSPDLMDASYYNISFSPGTNRDKLNSNIFIYNELSLGTRRLLRLLVSIIHDHRTVSLLEHPEDGIHVGLLHKLIPLFKSYSDRGQFILASHSPEIFNRLEPQEIRLVTMAKGITYLRALDETEIDAAHQFIREQGALSDFLETIPEE